MEPLPFEPPLLLTPAQVARMLGVGRRTLYSLLHAGKLPPSYRLGGERVWRRDDITLWVEWGMPPLERFQTLASGKGGKNER